MNALQLCQLIRKNGDLEDKRNPMFERNRFAKILIYGTMAYYAALLLLGGIIMPLIMRHAYHGVASFHVLDGWAWLVIIADFWLRFIFQETPAQQIKPYILLPIRRSFLLHQYLLEAITSTGNLFWGFMLIPFGLIAIVPMLGWGAFFGWIAGWWLLIVANSQMYMLTRAACMKHLLWFLPMLLMHVLLLMLALLPEHNMVDMPCTWLMYGFLQWNILPFVCTITLISILYYTNFRLQAYMLYNEVGNEEKVKVKHRKALALKFFDRYGILGEYLKMEIRLRLRNRQVWMQFILGLVCMVSLSLLLNFTDVYDGSYMTSFVCLYGYVVLGMMTLITIMEHEGNYIDGLMSRKESILQLLYAKYYFNSSILLIPAILTIPSIILGKITLWLSMGYMFFTIGVLYPMMFQLAVYNKETITLNRKLTGRQSSTAQNIASFAILFLPIAFEKIIILLLGDPWGYVSLMILGMIGFATHRLWLRNIYSRFMQRRYENMESFRSTRKA